MTAKAPLSPAAAGSGDAEVTPTAIIVSSEYKSSDSLRSSNIRGRTTNLTGNRQVCLLRVVRKLFLYSLQLDELADEPASTLILSEIVSRITDITS